MASVRWSVGALKNLEDVFLFIARDSVTYAAAVSGRIVAATDRLAQFPMLGRVLPEFGEESLREVLVGNFRVIYRVRATSLVSLASLTEAAIF